MSIWFKDVESYDGARAATKGGMISCLVFAGMLGLGMTFLITAGGLPGSPVDPQAIYFEAGGIALEIVVASVGAWRFHLGKGRIAGVIVALLFVVEIVSKLMNGFAGLFWYGVYAAVFMGMLNGVRGAWALRDFQSAEDFADTFV